MNTGVKKLPRRGLELLQAQSVKVNGAKMEGEQRFERGRGLKARLGRPALIGPKIPKEHGSQQDQQVLVAKVTSLVLAVGLATHCRSKITLRAGTGVCSAANQREESLERSASARC